MEGSTRAGAGTTSGDALVSTELVSTAEALRWVSQRETPRPIIAMALGKANARRSTQGVIDEIWDYLQVAARLVQAAVRGEYTGLSGKSLTLIVAAIIYYVSPIDIIPDFIPVVGLLDDATVLAFALRSIKGELDTFKQWEAERGRGTDR